MVPQWEKLTEAVSLEKAKEITEPSYKERNLRYVASTDTLVRQKSGEIVQLLKPEKIRGPILDVGGGAGSLVRAVMEVVDDPRAVLFDIPEVIDAAHTLYPDSKDWAGITPVGGDFRTHGFEEKFSLICMSNFLHAYGADEARELLLKAVSLLDADGFLLIHDYFPDRSGAVQCMPCWACTTSCLGFHGVNVRQCSLIYLLVSFIFSF